MDTPYTALVILYRSFVSHDALQDTQKSMQSILRVNATHHFLLSLEFVAVFVMVASMEKNSQMER